MMQAGRLVTGLSEQCAKPTNPPGGGDFHQCLSPNTVQLTPDVAA